MRVRLTSNALRQLDSILDYIEERDPQGARRVQERLRDLIGLLERFPLSGQETSRSGRRRLIATPYPYAVFYRIRGDKVLIQRIRHTARKPI